MPPKKGAEGEPLHHPLLDQQGGSLKDELGQTSLNQAQEISKEALEKLAERLHALVGEEFELTGEPTLNDDGLPIVELMEPTPDTYSRSDFIPEPPKISTPKTETDKIAFRKARDAFIAALEEEERVDEEYIRREEEETEFMKAIRQAKEKIQEIRTSENTQANSGQLSSVATAEKKLGVPEDRKGARKNVSFAVDAKGGDDDDQLWGDVRHGRLRALKGPKSSHGIMKLEIVEKMPSL
ncbi:hypothetical protein FS842_009710 [Serendipita sp. 407]|nr:hypothetical protein FS842_009710 [Serendipita sp. 407]